MGVSPYASGEVGFTADGLIETYTVESGDTLIGIGQRFCVDYVTVGAYNDRFGTKAIQPGDVLILRP
ncbi:MAG TPA: LysM domain-containing protein, partial [Microbacterium sp.]|nr:LysM domain-containing protein [Microbacterium sp.]